jgi:hypothetical protein
MIEKNLGNIERALRLIAGLCLAVWAVTQPAPGAIVWFAVVISGFLVLNGVFSRCYLWFVLDINSRRAGCQSGRCLSGQILHPAAGPTGPVAAADATAPDSPQRNLADSALGL